MTITGEHLPQLAAGGGDVYASSNEKIGRIGQIYLDNETQEPKWVTVVTGLFGTGESFVPLTDAAVNGTDIVVGYTKDQVKDAPRIDPDGSLSMEEESALYRYYGLADVDDAVVGTAETGLAGDAGGMVAAEPTPTVGRDVSGPTTDDAMTRSEEQMRVGTSTQEAGRVRLRKYVVTENVTQTVPVSHEEVRLEREPITEANRDQALDGPAISEEEHEVTLHEERPVVEKQAVPVERVRLNTETVQEEETVSGEVRKEEIEFDDSQTTAPDPMRPDRGTGV